MRTKPYTPIEKAERFKREVLLTVNHFLDNYMKYVELGSDPGKWISTEVKTPNHGSVGMKLSIGDTSES